MVKANMNLAGHSIADFGINTRLDKTQLLLFYYGLNETATGLGLPLPRVDLGTPRVKEERMRFLVIGRGKYPIPPEAAPGILDATVAWNKKLIDSGKGEASWGVDELPVGVGILNVDSLEELDAIMTESPLGPFGEVGILSLVDLAESLQRIKQAAQTTTAQLIVDPRGAGSQLVERGHKSLNCYSLA